MKSNHIEYKKSLACLYPQLAKEWHPIKNGDLAASDVSPTCCKKVFWLLPYDDPKTGRHFDFEWEDTVNNRTSGHKVWPGYNDLETYCKLNGMENLLDEWHPTKNGDIKPSSISAKSQKKVWWMLSYDDPITGKHFDFEWEATPSSRVSKKSGCPFLSGQKIWPGYNDLETYCKLNGMENLLDEWHPIRNEIILPSELSPKGNTKVWWMLPYDDPITGKHFDFEWEATPKERVSLKVGCPFLSGHRVWPGYNDLETYCKLNGMENLLDEWHPTRNGDLRPLDVLYRSEDKVWWFMSYIDPETSRKFNFEWKMSLYSRTQQKSGCPFSEWRICLTSGIPQRMGKKDLQM